VLVEIWSDVACPWCYVGKRRFERALELFEHRDEVTVRWRSFELDPGAPAERAVSGPEHLAAKYGISVEQARANNERLEAMAALEGLDLRLGALRTGNTFDAHRLIHLGLERGIQDAVKERFLHAYFTESALVADHTTLLGLAVEAGLDEAEARDVLASDRYADAVRADEREAATLGANGVPFFVIDRAFGVSGAQPSDVFTEVLDRAWAQAHPLTIVGGAGDASCEGDACAV
jgi:predicted DsbA family dithiol-disulfide isomerase